MECLVKKIKESDKYFELISNLKKSNKNSLSATGLTGSAKALYTYAITKELNTSSAIICSNVFQANKIIQDLKFFCDDIEIIFLPSRSIEYYDIEAESKEEENGRSYAIKKILEGKLNILVTTIEACSIYMEPKKYFENLEISFKVGESINVENLLEKLINLGYKRAEVVEGKGQFAIRGGIIDIFTIGNDLPYRIELFGDEIDNIRTFDVISQRSIDTVKSIQIDCASEFHISNEKRSHIITELKELVDKKDLNSDLKINILKDIEKIENNSLENIFDKYFEFFKEESQTIFDYLENYNIFVDEPSKCFERSQNLVYENEESLKVFASRNAIYLPYALRYLNYEQIRMEFIKKNNIYLEKMCINNSLHENRKVFSFNIKEELFYRNSLDTLLNDIKLNRNKSILLVFPNYSRIEEIKNYLIDNNINVKELNNISQLDKLENNVYITFGILSSGMLFEECSLKIIAENVSGVNFNKKKKKEKASGVIIENFEDLEIGDYLVHENHGIGIYKGIETVEVEGNLKDYIKIEYENDSAIYVPINQLDLVTKYICDDNTTPKLNTLGTKDWSVTKKKVTEHVQNVAKELMMLYAKREKLKGHSFLKDTPWQKEFEDSFPYELTDDQKQAVIEIKEDMENDKPMDRLLCGDVGYGKTEVALRAAFKAVVGGKQVAYLVPTTVLALQQYRTFKERMEKFGIKVDMLSRFKSKKQQNEILKDLVDGKIDVIVGTHRLLSKDVFFKDLGFLIIDEEHRFGVKAKESIKVLKETVDVLSMTATPIPRTLHMSMIGIRGMSTLKEPPIERLPVHTYVIEYDKNIVKNAIEKELQRDGQVFYINNRVNNIEEVANKVKEMVPYARVSFAHGQMDPKQIEDIMLSFINHEIDILVCTTILESGIDIPNANTIIIEDADKLGLAQLYQIRGRVGRSSRLAYAYVTYKKDKALSEVSEKRLKAIKDFTEFGSGFKIALRDLEIRGAGNLLGKEQHRTYGKSWI